MYRKFYICGPPGGSLISNTVEGGFIGRGALREGGGKINFLKNFNSKLNICYLKIENNFQGV